MLIYLQLSNFKTLIKIEQQVWNKILRASNFSAATTHSIQMIQSSFF